MLPGRGTSSRDGKPNKQVASRIRPMQALWTHGFKTGKPERSTMQSVHRINVFPFKPVHYVPAPIMLNVYK